MKIPTLFKPKKKLRASTARRSMHRPDEMDYEEMSEPNMKLSRALLIVLVLHVVAVAGIIAFNTIKTRQVQSAPTSIQPDAAKKTEEAAPAAGKTEAPIAVSNETAKPALPVAKETPAVAKALPVASSASGETYTVVKGDNPVSIARKFKVSESELLRINNIEDPRRLQIGQKLVIPAPEKKKK